MRQPQPANPALAGDHPVAPQLGENIGTAARAMANFGLADLRLVNPREGWPNDKARAAASGADHVLDGVARLRDRSAEAIADLGFVYATTARARDVAKPVIGPARRRRSSARSPPAGSRAGILFGRERIGLNNEELSLADEIVTFPVDPAFASLNIAQAVLLFAYEWRLAGFAPEERVLPLADGRPVPAPKEDLIRPVRASRIRARRDRLLPPAGEAAAHGRVAPRDAAARRLLRAGGADAPRRRRRRWRSGRPGRGCFPTGPSRPRAARTRADDPAPRLRFRASAACRSCARSGASSPAREIIYVADDAGFPYGDWEEAALTDRVVGLIAELIERIAPDARRHRLQHRLDAGAAAASRALRRPLRRHRAGDQAGGRADEKRRGQRARAPTARSAATTPAG